MTGFALLHFDPSPQADPALSGPVDLRQVLFIDNDAACGKIRALDIFHQAFRTDSGIAQVSDLGVNGLRQVMGRRIGGHTDRDAFRAVDQEIGDPDRQDGGFLFRLVKIGDKIHHIPVQIRQKGFLGDLFQPGLCITHGGGPVAFDVAKVPVAVDQGQLLFEILGHHDQGVIDGAVTVGMVFTHGIADDPG